MLEIQEGTVPSALAIDNIRLVRVPEPDAAGLFLLSMLGAAVTFIRRRGLRENDAQKYRRAHAAKP
jgi:hypothetical protein